MKYYLYRVAEFKILGSEDKPSWHIENRYYHGERSLEDFDLKDIPGKRTGAKFIGIVERHFGTKASPDEELRLLVEYMDIYIQLLPYTWECGGKRWPKVQLPTFEYFKKTRKDHRYSLAYPGYKTSRNVFIPKSHAHGLGSSNGIGYKYYNFWMGAKYYTGSNMGNANGSKCLEELMEWLS